MRPPRHPLLLAAACFGAASFLVWFFVHLPGCTTRVEYSSQPAAPPKPETLQVVDGVIMGYRGILKDNDTGTEYIVLQYGHGLTMHRRDALPTLPRGTTEAPPKP